LHNVLKAKETDVAAYVSALKPLSGQKGLLALANVQVVGLDVRE
jgi:hypothetical protein